MQLYPAHTAYQAIQHDSRNALTLIDMVNGLASVHMAYPPIQPSTCLSALCYLHYAPTQLRQGRSENGSGWYSDGLFGIDTQGLVHLRTRDIVILCSFYIVFY